jgi:TonB family protein
MREAVSSILNDRARDDEGLSRLLLLSLGAHIALVVAIVLMPSEWHSSKTTPDNVMMISLGGVEGPETGGMTAIADRAVQAIARPDAPRRVETPLAMKAPEMVEPERMIKPRPAPTPPTPAVQQPAQTSRTRTPTAGPEIKPGAARVPTGGAAIPFGGLASGGGGAGAGVRLDVQNFCCPEYLVQMVQMIRRNWNANQGAGGQPVVKFTIRRDGVLTQVELEKTSGQALLDMEARRAVLNTKQLPPLPREFTEPHLTVYLTFDFQR